MRALGAEGRHANNLWGCHGMTPADKQAMLDAQGSSCYLCSDQITYADAVIDHDHSCCPPGKSCAYCRRGLACHPCNTAIGMAADDPERLRRIADALAAVLPSVSARLASKSRQGDLFATEASDGA